MTNKWRERLSFLATFLMGYLMGRDPQSWSKIAVGLVLVAVASYLGAIFDHVAYECAARRLAYRATEQKTKDDKCAANCN